MRLVSMVRPPSKFDHVGQIPDDVVSMVSSSSKFDHAKTPITRTLHAVVRAVSMVYSPSKFDHARFERLPGSRSGRLDGFLTEQVRSRDFEVEPNCAVSMVSSPSKFDHTSLCRTQRSNSTSRLDGFLTEQVRSRRGYDATRFHANPPTINTP